MTAPIGAGRPATLRAIEAALATPERLVFAVSQRQNVESVNPDVLYTIGTIAQIGQLQRGLAGMQLLLHGEQRGIAIHYTEKEGYLQAVVREAEEMLPLNAEDPAFVALHREARARAAELGQKSGLPEEVVQQVLAGVNEPGRFADLVAGYIDITPAQRQGLLETLSVEERLRRVLVHVQRQIGVLDAQEEIKSQVQEELGERQREMYLREQLKAIQRELGEGDERDDLQELREKLEALELPAEARKEVDRELGRLTPDRPRVDGDPGHPHLPRDHRRAAVERAQQGAPRRCPRRRRILDEDHYGLGDVKDRVLEFLAVRQLRMQQEAAEQCRRRGRRRSARPRRWPTASRTDTPQATATVPAPNAAVKGNDDDRARGPILLFVGPPGVGKTSIAKSIARAMGRKYVRISLGGARDEADIRGHRRTYVGAMPGRIIQGMKQAGTKNPVFLLDEVDKLGVSFQGDPASALLEVLDPAQNDTFADHYLGVPFDLSEVLFIATANFIQNIPGPLLDRMEVVDFAGYTEREKQEIARKYLIPRQFTENGVSPEQLDDHRRGAGRGDHQLHPRVRRAPARAGDRPAGPQGGAQDRRGREPSAITVDKEMVDDLLGRPRVHPEKMARQDEVGVATGMYYTPTGGDIMFVEASHDARQGRAGPHRPARRRHEGVGPRRLDLRPLARGGAPDRRTRCSTARSTSTCRPAPSRRTGRRRASRWPRPSCRALSGRPVRHDIAMTGEITLRGRVLPIGGVKEKVLGAVRAGITRIILPKDNEPDLEDLPQEVRDKIEVHLVSELGEVLALTLRGATFREGRLLFGDEKNPRDVMPLSTGFRH